jgi:hypothetical protein
LLSRGKFDASRRRAAVQSISRAAVPALATTTTTSTIGQPVTAPVLSPAVFATEREAEILQLTKAIRTLVGTRRASQSLPRHLRRRASSHNPYRVPARLLLVSKK